MYKKFRDCLFSSNSAIPQQFVTPISSLCDAKFCYPYWNGWLITPLLYNAVRTGKCPHSFYRR